MKIAFIKNVLSVYVNAGARACVCLSILKRGLATAEKEQKMLAKPHAESCLKSVSGPSPDTIWQKESFPLATSENQPVQEIKSLSLKQTICSRGQARNTVKLIYETKSSPKNIPKLLKQRLTCSGKPREADPEYLPLHHSSPSMSKKRDRR